MQELVIAAAVVVGFLAFIWLGGRLLKPLFYPLAWVADWLTHLAFGTERPRRGPFAPPPNGL